MTQFSGRAELRCTIWILDDALSALHVARDLSRRDISRVRTADAADQLHCASLLAPAGYRMPLRALSRDLRRELKFLPPPRPAVLARVADEATMIRAALAVLAGDAIGMRRAG